MTERNSYEEHFLKLREQYAQATIEDPMLERKLGNLLDASEHVSTSLQSEDPQKYCESVLLTCRYSRSIRIHVGNVSDMQGEALDIYAQCLDFVLQNTMDATQIQEEKRQDFCDALENLEMRLSKCGDYTLSKNGS